jgi:hypothetical protein
MVFLRKFWSMEVSRSEGIKGGCFSATKELPAAVFEENLYTIAGVKHKLSVLDESSH